MQWCREMLALSPFALRLREGELPRRTRTATRASSSSPTTRTSSSTPPRRRKEGREAYKEKRAPDFSQFPRRAVSVARAHLAHGRAAADAARGGRARARRHGAGRHRAATFRAGAFIAALLGAIFIQVGDEPLQRLLRRAPRRRHRGPPRPGARDRRRPRAARGRCSSRPTSRSALAVLCGIYLDRRRRPGAAADRRARRSSPACSTPAARGPTATRASARSSSSCSSASSR